MNTFVFELITGTNKKSFSYKSEVVHCPYLCIGSVPKSQVCIIMCQIMLLLRPILDILTCSHNIQSMCMQ